MISEWKHTQDVALYKRDIENLQREIKKLNADALVFAIENQRLTEIEEEHRKLNGELRLEIAEFHKHYKILTGKEFIPSHK